MNSELLELGRRAVACKGWRWMGGMLGSDGSTLARVLVVDDEGTPTEWAVMEGTALSRFLSGYGSPGWCRDVWGMSIPDFSDPTTLGCVEHGLLPLGWYLVPLLAEIGGVAGWTVYRPTDRASDRPVCRPCESKGAALVAALEAMP